MILKKANIRGFGKLKGITLEFHPNISLVYGPNEAGKSTLQQSLLYLLFGFHQSNRATKRENDLRDRYQPWHSGEYGGQIWYKLKDGQSYQVDRIFAEGDIQAKIFDELTGKELTEKYLTGRHGSMAFQKSHMGMERELFEATAFVRQAQVRNIAGSEHLVDAIIGVMDSGSREASAKSALEFLKKQINDIGSDRATKKQLPRLRQRLSSLSEELEQHRNIRATLSEKIQEKSQLEDLLAREDLKRIELNYLILTRMIDEKEKQLSKLSMHNQDLNKIREDISELADAGEFPVESREAVMRRRQNQANYEEQINEKNRNEKELENEISVIEERIRPFLRFQSIQNMMPFAEYRSLADQWSSKQAEFESARDILDKEELALLQQDVDLDLLRQLQDLQPAEIEKMTRIDENRSQVDSELNHLEAMSRSLENRTWAKRWVRPVMLISIPFLSLLILALSYIFQFDVGYPIAAGVLVCGAVLYHFYHRARLKISAQYDSVSNDIAQARKKREELNLELQDFYRRFGVSSLSMLVSRQMQNKRYLKLCDDLGRATEEKERLEFQLLKYLQTIDIRKITPDTLRQITQDYGEFNELNTALQNLQQRKDQLEKDRQSILGRMEDNRSILQGLLAEAKIETSDLDEALKEFDRRYARRKHLDSLGRDQEKHQSAIDGILTTHTEQELHSELGDLLKRREALLSHYPDMAKKSSNRTLPVLREEYEAIDKNRQGIERDLTACKSAIEAGLEQHRPQAELEEEIAEVQERVTRLEEMRDSLQLAGDILKEVADEYHRNIIPELNEFVSKGMKSISEGKYVRVNIDPTDLTINVLFPETDSLGSSEYLSLGTQEQLYLLLRIGLSRLVAKNSEPIPLLLDDPFVHFDHTRLANVLSFLSKVSRENQIFLFTKEPFIVEWFEDHLQEIEYSQINLDNLSEESSIQASLEPHSQARN